nr:hypothetical protein [Tanacetum cinerariifolium]
TWILESFQAATDDSYTRYHRLPKIVAWSSKIRDNYLLRDLVPDEIEARSRWWVSSRAYFDGRNIEDERIPRHLNRNGYFEVPSEMYREFKEQRMGYKQMMEKSDDMYKKMSRLMEDMRVGQVPQANKEPIIADQHYGISDLSRFQSNQKKGKAAKLSPLDLGNTFVDENVSGEDVTITGVQQTDNFFYKNVDPDKHMNSWIQILIRERAENDNWTLSKSGTICLHPENNHFMILTDPHIIGTLDGSMRPYPSWKNVNWYLFC